MYKVAITGKANSGKNTLSKMLVKQLRKEKPVIKPTLTEWFDQLEPIGLIKGRKAHFYHKTQFDLAWERKANLLKGKTKNPTMATFFQYTWKFSEQYQRWLKIRHIWKLTENNQSWLKIHSEKPSN